MDRILPATVSPIALLLAGLLLEMSLLRVGIDDLDEGYFVQQAVRVLHGQVPFRDFETLYSPAQVYLHAALFGLVGSPSLIAERAGSLVARGVLVLAMFGLAKPLVRNPWWAAAPGLLLLVGMDDSPVRWEPHPGWLSTVFAVLAAWCLMAGLSTRRLIAAGAFAALAYAFKQNTGVFILLAILIWTRHSRPLVPIACWVALTLVWLVPLAMSVGTVTRMGALVGAVNGSALFAPPEPTLLIPLGALAGGVWLLRRDSDPRLRWLLLSGTALLLTEFPRMDTQHLAWSAPLLLVVGAVALDRAPRLIGLTALVASLALLAPTLLSRVSYVSQDLVPVADLEAPASTAAELQGVVAEIHARAEPGEPIFVYPTSPLLYVLADRPNPTRFDHLNPGAADPAQIEQVIADLERSEVRLVVVSDFWEDAWHLPGSGPNAALEGWLNAHFTAVARDGAYRVMWRDL